MNDNRMNVTVPSTASIFQHPIHPMLVIYPIGFLMGTLATDLGYWWTKDAFWAQASFWLLLAGLGMGILAALVGLIDFTTMPLVREHITSWGHFLAGVMVLALASANLRPRLDDPIAAVLPWGLFLSIVTALMVFVTGWLGGSLTFRHSIGSYGGEPAEEAGPEIPLPRD